MFMMRVLLFHLVVVYTSVFGKPTIDAETSGIGPQNNQHVEVIYLLNLFIDKPEFKSQSKVSAPNPKREEGILTSIKSL